MKNTKKTAYEIGFAACLEIYPEAVPPGIVDVPRKERARLLGEFGIQNTSEEAAEFVLGFKAAKQKRYDEAAPERARKAATKQRVEKYVDACNRAFAKERRERDDEEMWNFAQRQRMEALGATKAPKEILEATEEFLS